MRRGLNQLSGRTSRIRRRRIRRSRPTKTPSPLKSCQQTLKARPGLTPVTCPSPSPPSPRSSPRATCQRPWGFLGGFLKTHRDFRICRQKPLRHFIPHRRALLRRLSPKDTALRFHSPLSPLRPARGYADLCSPPATPRPCQPMTMSICAQLNKPGAFSWLSKNRSRQAEGRRHP